MTTKLIPILIDRSRRRLSSQLALDLTCAVLLVGFSAMAQSNAANLAQVKLSNTDLPGFSVIYEGDRDWALFTLESGAPAECLKGQPIINGREQVWKRNATEAKKTDGRLRVDYAVFDTPGQAASAARAAALLINNATERMEGNETIGDASWRTIAGSSSLIVANANAVFYVSAQGDSNTSEGDLAQIAQKLVLKANTLSTKLSFDQFACDVDVYAGLNLISPKVARQISQGATRRRPVEDLKSLINSETGKGIQREAAVNLLRSLSAMSAK